jgi:hypothetical protein
MPALLCASAVPDSQRAATSRCSVHTDSGVAVVAVWVVAVVWVTKVLGWPTALK